MASMVLVLFKPCSPYLLEVVLGANAAVLIRAILIIAKLVFTVTLEPPLHLQRVDHPHCLLSCHH